MKTTMENAIEARLKMADLPVQKKALHGRLEAHLIEKCKVIEYLTAMSDAEVYNVTRPPKVEAAAKVITATAKKQEGAS